MVVFSPEIQHNIIANVFRLILKEGMQLNHVIFTIICECEVVYLLSAAEGSLPGQMHCQPGAEWRVSVEC